MNAPALDCLHSLLYAYDLPHSLTLVYAGKHITVHFGTNPYLCRRDWESEFTILDWCLFGVETEGFIRGHLQVLKNVNDWLDV